MNLICLVRVQILEFVSVQWAVWKWRGKRKNKDIIKKSALIRKY